MENQPIANGQPVVSGRVEVIETALPAQIQGGKSATKHRGLQGSSCLGPVCRAEAVSNTESTGIHSAQCAGAAHGLAKNPQV